MIRSTLIALVLFCAPAMAGTAYVAPPADGGSDGNDCLAPSTPCATVQGAVDKTARTERTAIHIAPGTYPDAIDVSFRPFGVTLRGKVGTCAESDAAAVVLSAGVVAQDYTNLNARCVTLGGATGLYCRQLAICDYVDVRLAATTTQLSAVELSMLNCGGSIWIRAGGSSVVSLNQSKANMGCWFDLPSGLSYRNAFVIGVNFSVFNMQGMQSAAHSIALGKQWILTNSILYRPQQYAVPGSGVFETASSVY